MAEPHFIPVCEWEDADGLPGGWRQGFEGWSFAKRLLLRNDLAEPRSDEPVEVELEFHAGQVADPAREVRVLAVPSGAGPGRELVSQIQHLGTEDGRHRCRLWFLADLAAGSTHTWLVLYGNPSAPAPRYETDLRVQGTP